MKITFECNSISEIEELKLYLNRGMTLKELEDNYLSKKYVVQELSIEDIPLTFHTKQVLEAENIKTIEQLLTLTENGVLRVPNMGRKALNEIKEVLASRGLHLKDSQ